MKFRDDIDPANTWLVSDTHFGHNNIVGFCHRPEDHEQVMIAEWRKAVPDDATVLHLGDVTYRNNAFFKHVVAPELTGARKLLIIGNHDKSPYKFYRDCGFRPVRPFMLHLKLEDDGFVIWPGDPGIKGADHTVSFSHYAWGEERDDEGPMPFNHTRIHGHIHNNGYSREAFVPFLRDHINISVEQMRYTPVNLKLLLDGAVAGIYPRTTEESLREARERKAENQLRKDRTNTHGR